MTVIQKGNIEPAMTDPGASLRESEERFRATFEQAAVGMAHLSPEGRWLRVNGKLCDILKYPLPVMLQMTFQEITAEEDRAPSVDTWQRLLRGEIDRALAEKRYIRADGTLVWARVTSSLVRTPAGEPQYFIAVIQDISQEKEMELQFLRAQRLESVGTLASGVAHDLNNILAPILMSAPMLRSEWDEATREHLIETIESSARRGADLVRQILTFTRGIEGNRLLLQPVHILREVADIVHGTFPKNITVSVRHGTDVWPVFGNPTQLHQILMNLLVNARDAMPGGGVITLEAGNVDVDGQYAATLGNDLQPGPFVLLTVTDHGSGIPDEIKDRIFDPFFTTKAVGKGTGLGLSTAAGIARSHSGSITVESEKGKGARFSIHLPASPGEAPVDEENRPESVVPGNGELILVVDDEKSILGMTRLILEKAGYRIAVAWDGIEGVAYFAGHMDEVAIVLTDVYMPNLDGLSLVHTVRKLHPTIPIIGSTGQTCHDEERKLSECGVDRFLRKPYTKRQLLDTIRELLPKPQLPQP